MTDAVEADDDVDDGTAAASGRRRPPYKLGVFGGHDTTVAPLIGVRLGRSRGWFESVQRRTKAHTHTHTHVRPASFRSSIAAVPLCPRRRSWQCRIESRSHGDKAGGHLGPRVDTWDTGCERKPTPAHAHRGWSPAAADVHAGGTDGK
jgi:hypothetical protein